VISGGTGSGKTTLLNVLSAYIPSDERVITIEDAAELRCSNGTWPAGNEASQRRRRGQVTTRDLVAVRLRMRPDRSSWANAAVGKRWNAPGHEHGDEGSDDHPLERHPPRATR